MLASFRIETLLSIMRFWVSGSGFQQNKGYACVGSLLALRRHIGNQQDANAIQIVDSSGRLVGWVPRAVAAAGLAQFLDRGDDRRATATVTEVRKLIPRVCVSLTLAGPAEELQVLQQDILDAI